jgi:hypothetical protein
MAVGCCRQLWAGCRRGGGQLPGCHLPPAAVHGCHSRFCCLFCASSSRGCVQIQSTISRSYIGSVDVCVFEQHDVVVWASRVGCWLANESKAWDQAGIKNTLSVEYS